MQSAKITSNDDFHRNFAISKQGDVTVEGRTVLFNIGPVEVSSVMTTMAAITILLALLAYFSTRHLQERPTGIQNLMEKWIEMLRNFLAGIVGERNINYYFPYLATLFVFILVSNYSGLIPFCGIIPGFAAPTSVVNVTAGLAVCTFCLTHYAGIKNNGPRYIRHFTKPFIFMLPLILIDEFVRPLSLTLRLYGNIFGEETVGHEIFNLIPVAVPVILQALSLLMGFIQALVFVLLSAFYIGESSEEL